MLAELGDTAVEDVDADVVRQISADRSEWLRLSTPYTPTTPHGTRNFAPWKDDLRASRRIHAGRRTSALPASPPRLGLGAGASDRPCQPAMRARRLVMASTTKHSLRRDSAQSSRTSDCAVTEDEHAAFRHGRRSFFSAPKFSFMVSSMTASGSDIPPGSAWTGSPEWIVQHNERRGAFPPSSTIALTSIVKALGRSCRHRSGYSRARGQHAEREL